MRRLVIAHPHVTYPGGATAVALETGQRLADAGYDVHLVSLRHLPELTEHVRGIRFHDLGGPLSSEFRYWATLPVHHRRFHRLVDALKPDVVLAHVFPANYWAFVYRARRPEVRCVWYCHEPSAFVHDRRVIRGVGWPMRGTVLAANPLLQVGDRWLARYADAIVANSEYTAARVEKIYARRALVAPPGVDAERFGLVAEKEPLVLAVGRLTRFKRFDLVLRAAALLKAHGVPATWVIAGGGEEEAPLRRLAADLAVLDTVEFAGRVDERTLAGYFARASIVAVTSIGEPFGIVPVEAMVAGAAVVCSDSGGPSLTVLDGTTGLHFRSGDAADFAAKVAHLLQDRELAREMGRRGRRVALERYTWERTTAGIAAALEQALTAPRDRAGPCGTAT